MKGYTILLKGVKAGYSGRIVLNGISIELPKSSITAVLGPSGCGKTTLLRVIAGLTRVYEGQVFFDGRDVTHLPPEKRDVGLVFQDLALFPHMTVFENVAFGLKVRGVQGREARRRVEWVLETVGLTPPREFMNRRVTELSGGQQQRVALARAIVYEPGVLLLDEPLAHLDLKIRQRLVSELKKIQRKIGTTMIYVTHDQWEAMELADMLVIMKEGRIIQSGSPVDVYTRPANTYVATFFGDANIIPAGLVSDSHKGKGSILIVRPEDITIKRADPGINGFYKVSGIVAEVVFQGPLVRVELKWDGGILKALVPRKKATALPRPGERAFAVWRPGDSILVEDAGDEVGGGEY